MYFLSTFWGRVLNNLFLGFETKIYHYKNTNYPILENIPIEQIHLEFLNIFFAILFAIFLALSIYFNEKE